MVTKTGTIMIGPKNTVAKALFPTSIKENGKTFKLIAISTKFRRSFSESIIGKLRGMQTRQKFRKVILVYGYSPYAKTTVIRKKRKKK